MIPQTALDFIADNPKYQAKMHSDNRTLVLKIVDGKKPLNSIGLVDARMFKGGNNLRAIREPMTSLWRLEYDSGILPQALRKKFTSINKLMTYVTDYMGKRNIRVEKIVD
jgi:hypothetical protein